jgi:hypothetical protein
LNSINPNAQPQAVHAEKQSIYNPCCEDLQHKYNLNFPIEVIGFGLMIGSRVRGKIPTDFHSLIALFHPLNLSKSTTCDIALYFSFPSLLIVLYIIIFDLKNLPTT